MSVLSGRNPVTTSGGHCGSSVCGQLWLSWELGRLWLKRCAHVGGGGLGRLRSPFQGSLPCSCCSLGTGTALGLPSCAQASACSLSCIWAPLHETGAAARSEVLGNLPLCIPYAQQWLRRGWSIQNLAVRNEMQPACTSLPAFREGIVGWFCFLFGISSTLLHPWTRKECAWYKKYVLNCWDRGVSICCLIPINFKPFIHSFLHRVFETLLAYK